MVRGVRWTCGLVVAAMLLVARAMPAAAQVGAGALAGLVSDPSGHAVAGALIIVTLTSNGQTRTTVSASDGGFVVPGLVPGTYTVRVESNGFRPLSRDGVTVATGETVALGLGLTVGGVSEAIDRKSTRLNSSHT